MAKAQGVLVEGAPTIEGITRRRGGRFFIGHDGTFGPLLPGAFNPRPGVAQALQHRRWEPISLASEMGFGVSIVSEMEMKRVRVPEFLKDAVEIELLQGVQEMITTSQGAMDLLEKVRIDVEFGLAEIPLLYGPIYERINGPFPGGVVQIGPDMVLDANVVFLEKFEAGEIVFGTLAKAGAPTVAPISTYAAGFEWTEDMLEYDRTYEIGMNSRAFGRAYNYVLNHIHLSPIIAYTYVGDNLTAAATGGASLQANMLATFQNAYKTAVQDIPQRIPSVILANEADRFNIEDALLTPVLDANGNPLRRVPVDTIIYYNGATVTNGVKQFVYPGVTAGTCFFIFPRQRFKELVHHDLRIDIGPEDISRLVEGQQVARTRRGLYADMANSVQKITLPTS
jgi:hypothetical protein